MSGIHKGGDCVPEMEKRKTTQNTAQKQFPVQQKWVTPPTNKSTRPCEETGNSVSCKNPQPSEDSNSVAYFVETLIVLVVFWAVRGIYS